MALVQMGRQQNTPAVTHNNARAEDHILLPKPNTLVSCYVIKIIKTQIKSSAVNVGKKK